MTEIRIPICYCSVCDGLLYQGDALADHKKYESDGELDYIELAHVECAREENTKGQTPYQCTYWEYDESLSPSPS